MFISSPESEYTSYFMAAMLVVAESEIHSSGSISTFPWRSVKIWSNLPSREGTLYGISSYLKRHVITQHLGPNACSLSLLLCAIPGLKKSQQVDQYVGLGQRRGVGGNHPYIIFL